MSKVIYWSPFHGQGQTSNLHVTAFIMGLLHRKRVLMMQTHFCQNNLERPLVGRNVGLRGNGENELFDDVGLDVAVTYSIMNHLNREIFEKCCFSLPGTPLLLLPGTEIKNKETFDRDIGNHVSRVIRDAERCADFVLIDANSGEDKLSLQLMSQADLVIVNLTQHRHVLEKFFQDYYELFLDNEKVFYLFGDYDPNSSYNLHNCRKKYSRFLNSKNSGIIPYSTMYMDAQNECDVLSFMKKGLKQRKEKISDKAVKSIRRCLFSGTYYKEDTKYFFHQSKLAVEKIFDLLNIAIRGNNREEARDGDL